MTEQIQEVFWLTSAERQDLLYVSPSFETIWGRSPESLYTYPGGHLNLIVDSIHPSDRERVVAALTQQLQNEYKQEYRIVRPDGSIRWVRSRSFPVQNPYGETWGIAGLSEDITLAKQSEELLHQREQEFRAIVEHSPDPICRLDRELRYVYVNPAVEAATGIPFQEFLGKTIDELGMPQAVVTLWEHSSRNVFQTGQEDENEFSFFTPNGQKYYQSRVVPELAADGSIETILVISRDITKNKQTEEALRESEERFRTVFESAPIGIAIINLHGIPIQSNQAFQEILGYTAEELENLSFRDFTHPDDRIESLKLFQELLVGKRSHFSLEKRYCRKDDRIVWSNVSVSVICDTNGLPQYAFAMIQDISDVYGELRLRKQAQLDLQKAHNELEKRVAERTAELTQVNQLLQQEIAERQLLTEELKAQKEFLQTVLDTNPNKIFVKDTEGKYVLVNQACADFWRITVEDMLGHTDTELIFNQADAKQFVAHDQEVLTTLQQKFIPEEACHTPTGEVRWFQTIKKPLFSSDGQVRQVFGVCADITERKLAQEALRLSEARFRLALDNIPDVFVIYDAQRRIQFVNAQGLRTSGKSLEEHLGHTDEDIWSSEVTKYYLPILKRAVETRTTQTGECNITLPHTGTFTIIVSYVPLLNEQGEIYQILGITYDITKRKLAEEKLRQSEEQLRLALEVARMGNWNWNLLTGIITRSNNLERLFGWNPGSSDGTYESFLAILHPEDRDRVHQFTQRSLETGENYDIEFRIIWPDGSIHWIESKGQVFYDEMGNPVRMTGVNLDITGRKLAEEKLRQSEAQLRLALDAARMGFWDWNLQTGVVTRSPSLKRLFGWSPDTVNNTKEVFLATVHPEDRDRVRQADQRSIEMGHSYNIEFRIVRPDESIRWIEAKGQAVCDETGKPIRMTGINVDITERKLAETQIKESLREKEVLLQEIHHRVKNNLQVISSLLDLQSQHINEQAPQEAFRESCNRVKSMALVHEQLYQSKDCAKINFTEYIQNLTSYLLRVYDGVNAGKITLELDIDDVTLNINIAIPCGLIISELISNALKYAFPNSTNGIIKVALHSDGNKHFTLIVSDNGIGFPRDWEFNTVTSLGLQLVNVLTSQLEGIIELDRSLGTKFRISFSETT